MPPTTGFYIAYSTQYGTAPAQVSREYSGIGDYTLTVDDLPELAYPGYTFLGWTATEGSSDVLAVYDAPFGYPQSDATYTLYAVWEVNRTIQTEIDRLNSNISNTYAALEELGATMPEAQNSDNLEATARTVTAGNDNSTIFVTFTKGATTTENTIDSSYDEILEYLDAGRDVVVRHPASETVTKLYYFSFMNTSAKAIRFHWAYQNQFEDIVISQNGTVGLEQGASLLPSRKVNGRALTADITLTASDVAAVSLPLNEDETTPDYGTAGQYAISDGKGGIKWVDLPDGSEVSY